MSKQDQPTAMNGASMNISEQRKRELGNLFPGIFTETRNDAGELVGTIDFERLKAELGQFSEIYDNRRERYGMDWPGKRDSLRLIQAPSYATLKPCREESVDFDTTENLFIEGDNLEVLKLLQKSYYGQVKMIYIDPPYNTGKEFIYPDNFSESLDTYLQYAGLKDSQGRTFSTNTANEGRFHTKWLNMMFPRLYLARNLLREDGVIFISIDYREATNLRKIMDEIFGEENLVFDVAVVNNLKGRNDREGIATCHEHLFIYCKPRFVPQGLPLTQEKVAEYDQVEDSGRLYQWRDLRKRGGADTRKERPNMYYPVYVDPDSGKASLQFSNEFCIEVFPVKSDGVDGRWRWGKEKAQSNIDLIFGKEVSGKGKWNINYKVYLDGSGEDERRSTPKSIWLNPKYSTDSATKSLASVFEGLDAKKFTPKPIGLIRDIIEHSITGDDIVLDFFSGTATTAVAVLQSNLECSRRLKFIMVQLPELIEEELPEELRFIRTVSDLSKERIRRVGAIIRGQVGERLPDADNTKIDLGFKSLKLDQSNFKPWQAPDKDVSDAELIQQIELSVDHVDPNASQEDLLYELLLKAGVKPTEKIEVISLAGHQVFSVAEGHLLVHLDNQLDQALIDAVLKQAPSQFICLDKAFHGNDQLKTNAVRTFATFNNGKVGLDRVDFKTV